MSRWNNTVFDSSAPGNMQLQTTYRSNYDSFGNYGRSDINNVNAYAKAQNPFYKSRSSNMALSYDGQAVNFMSGGRNPARGILPQLSGSGHQKNFIQQNWKQAANAPIRNRPKYNPDTESLLSFIDDYKHNSQNQQNSFLEPLDSHRSGMSKFGPGSQKSFTQRESSNQRTLENHVTRANQSHRERISSPYSHVSRRAAAQLADEYRREKDEAAKANRDNSSANQDREIHVSEPKDARREKRVRMDIPSRISSDQHRDARLEDSLYHRNDRLSDDESPRRQQRHAHRHTVAMQDRAGNVITWVENDSNKRYDSVAQYFDENVIKHDTQSNSLRYGGHFESDHKKQISGTFGALGGPISDRAEIVNRQQTGQLSRPQLYRNVTGWRGDSQWGESTYNSTFAKRQDMDEIEMTFPLKHVSPRSGLKNVVEVQTYTDRTKPSLLII